MSKFKKYLAGLSAGISLFTIGCINAKAADRSMMLRHTENRAYNRTELYKAQLTGASHGLTPMQRTDSLTAALSATEDPATGNMVLLPEHQRLVLRETDLVRIQQIMTNPGGISDYIRECISTVQTQFPGKTIITLDDAIQEFTQIRDNVIRRLHDCRRGDSLRIARLDRLLKEEYFQNAISGIVAYEYLRYPQDLVLPPPDVDDSGYYTDDDEAQSGDLSVAYTLQST